MNQEQVEGRVETHKCAKVVLMVIYVSTVITAAIVITVIVLSVIFIHRAENSYADNQARILYNHNISVMCPIVLNISRGSCDYLCYLIFERANFSVIGQQCIETLLYLNINDSKFIVDCIGVFKDTGSRINKDNISTYSDYITGQNIQNIMLPFICFSLFVQIIMICGIRKRLRS